MVNFKKEIANTLSKQINIDSQELENYIEIPKDETMGEYAFPCFRLAKVLKKSPQAIAEELREKIEINPKEPRYLKVIWGVGYKVECI